MQIAICDDSREDAGLLASLLAGQSVDVFADADALLGAIGRGQADYDLYLLDIVMGEQSGITLAKAIRELHDDAAICFVSSSDAFYREAYDLMDVNYLLKPVKEGELQKLLTRIGRRQGAEKRPGFSFKWNGIPETVLYDNILFISSNGHTLSISCRDGSVRPCKGKLSDIGQQLDPNVFVRCHQSFLVNLYRIDHLDGNELVIGRMRIPVSRRYYAELKKRYLSILFEEVSE